MVRSAVLLTSLALSGCHGVAVYGSYEHLSSIPLVNDLNTVDQVGVSVEFPVSDHPYATQMEVGMFYELDKAKPVFGPSPIGLIRIRQPLYRSGK